MRAKQQKRVLEALEAGRVISRLDGLDMGVGKVPSRISELIDQGYPIMKAWKTYFNRYGEKIRVRCYWLPKDLKEVK